VNTGGFAYLFQGTNLVVGEEVPDNGVSGGTPLEAVARDFKTCEIFEIPAVEGPAPVITVSIPADRPLPPGWRTVPVRQSLSQCTGGTVPEGRELTGRMLRAFHISQWRAESRFCGSCGTQNTDAPEELARQCPACGRLEFPRIAPAVITLIINDSGEALLAHNKKFAPGVYSLIAGFNEAGEGLENTVVREIREEVNIEVRNIRYITSQPWPFPNSLMLGFTARYASGVLRPDGREIEDAQWFPRNKLPLLPGTGSVSRYLINHWINGKLDAL
jgi:NAD+ diphosphatase